MKPPGAEGFNRPFDGLKELLRRKSKAIQPDASAPRPAPRPAVPELSDAEAFAAAMAGVARMDREPTDDERPPPPARPASPSPEAGIEQLRRLIENGSGFVVYDTPEYIEGVGRRAPPGITRRLHRGDFAVQAHLDLHGLTVDAAWEIFDAFMRESIAGGRSGVLVIHGRGLSSPGEPVLKTKVAQWLSSGPWHKWVIAFASARMCDGGSGATYVLLRRSPLGKRHRRRKG
jgi:DNA-nicking Smr family endonuclease